MKFFYPLIFKEDNGKFKFYCPYLKEVKGTYYDFSTAFEKATEMLRLSVQARYENIPESLAYVSPQEIMSLEIEKGAKAFILATTPRIKYERKTITIPYELKVRVEQEGINLSQFVQEALYEKFGNPCLLEKSDK